MQAFLFDDNTIRIDWFLATALGFVKLRGPSVGRPPALVFISFYPLFGTARATAIFSARIDIITDSRRRLDELS